MRVGGVFSLVLVEQWIKEDSIVIVPMGLSPID